MGKEGVEVRFCAEVEDLVEMGVVDVSEDAEELAVDVSCDTWEGTLEFVVVVGWKDGFVVEHDLDGGHDGVDVLRSCHRYESARGLLPEVVQIWSSRHSRTSMLRATFRKDTTKLVQIREEVIHVDSDPFHDVDILG